MFIRLRRIRAVAVLAALLVSWTAGPGAAFCFGMEGEMEMPSHGAAHGAVGGNHHGAPAPAPADHGDAPAAPECPWMAMSGGSCLIAPAPLTVAPSLAAIPLAAEYPRSTEVRDQLVGAALFRPPKG
jgi:hypothetical protein